VIYANAASQKQQKTAELGHDYRLEKWNPQVLHPAF